MADNYGISISGPGSGVAGAKANQLVMNTNNPFLKIDTQNKAGFQTTTLLITTDPPNPPGGGGNTFTQVYKFKHGYKYVPTVEMLCYVTNPPPGVSGTMTYFQDWGSLGNITPADANNFYCVADTTYVYFIIHKYNNAGIGTNALLTGTNLTVTTHVFVTEVV
jgi:hypothetical protein